MASISLPFTLTAGAAENVNQLNSNLSTITSLVNGNIDGANAPLLVSQYRTIVSTGSFFTGGTANGMYFATCDATFAGDGVASNGPFVFYIDPADYAVTGLTTRYRLRVSTTTNGTAPVASFTYGLNPVTATSGTSTLAVVASTATASSTVTRTLPASGSRFTDTSSDFTAAAGGYVFSVSSSATTNGFSGVGMHFALQVRNT